MDVTPHQPRDNSPTARETSTAGPTYVLSRWLFLRLLGVVYLIAFTSLALQVTRLIGEHGILPATAFPDLTRALHGGAAYRLFPSRCWLGAVRRRQMARVVAALQGDVPGRDDETGERRSGVASPHRARLPLLDAAAPAVDGVVRAAAAWLGAPGHDPRDVRDRAGRAVADLRAAPLSRAARRRLRPARARPARDRAHGELRLLQLARDRVVPGAAGRRHAAARAAAPARRRRGRAAVVAPRDGDPGGSDRAAQRAHLRARDRRVASGESRARGQPDPARRRAAALGQRLRLVSRDDDRAAGDR